MSAFSLDGQVALVTGANTGIGQAIAVAMAQAGANVIAAGRRDCDETLALIGDAGQGRGRGMRLDFSDPMAARDVFAAERIDILVNNAGIGPLAPAEAYPTAMWDTTMAVNLRGPFLVARAAAPGMIRAGWGRVINLASQASVIGIEGHVAYCASKAGILGMTRTMALEWGPKGVTVNAISPTVVETELGLSGWAGDIGIRARAAIPTRRFARPDEIAAAVLYLASDAAAMVNGENLMIDGGYTAI